MNDLEHMTPFYGTRGEEYQLMQEEETKRLEQRDYKPTPTLGLVMFILLATLILWIFGGQSHNSDAHAPQTPQTEPSASLPAQAPVPDK